MLETTLNKFPTGTEDFVTHDVLKDYIQDTAFKTQVHDSTHYDTEVKNVSKRNGKWLLETTTLHSDSSGKISRKTSSSVSKTMDCTRIKYLLY